MSMFNFDGQLVAGVLLDQQAGEVAREILDARNTTKVAQAWQQQLFALQQNYARLVTKYNNLADRYNGVLADNKRVEAAHAEAIADKDRRIAQLAAEKEDFRRIGYDTCTKLGEALDEIERLRIEAGELPPKEPLPDLYFLRSE